VKSSRLNHHYKDKVSGFKTWDQKEHALEYLLFPENIGTSLSIDEVSLSKGELYTFVTNKDGKGKQGTIVACIEGTKAQDIRSVLEKIPIDKRLIVSEVTLDMAANMEAGVRAAFPNSKFVTDRFHVVKLALDTLQHIRVKQKPLKVARKKNSIQNKNWS
jgi:transposase